MNGDAKFKIPDQIHDIGQKDEESRIERLIEAYDEGLMDRKETKIVRVIEDENQDDV